MAETELSANLYESGCEGPNGLHKKHQIKHGVPVHDVVKIVARLLFGGMLFAKAVDLGEASHAGLHVEAMLLPFRVIAGAFGRLRAGPHLSLFAA